MNLKEIRRMHASVWKELPSVPVCNGAVCRNPGWVG